MNEPDPLKLASLIAKTLERCKIRYLLGGSLASTALGEPRATLDVDMRHWATELGILDLLDRALQSSGSPLA